MKSYSMTRTAGPLEALERTTPSPEGEQVLLRIAACGVCHSDLHLWEGFFDLGGGRRADLSRGRTLPFTLGHEIAGEVVALGDAVAGAKIGDRRVVFPWIGCGDCGTCHEGDEHLCSTPRALGVNADGGYADHVLVPHERYLFDPGPVPLELACTYACSGLTAYSALAKARPRAEGRSLLVIGAGGVGLAALALARVVCDSAIVVADVDPAKLEVARKAGADHVVLAGEADASKQVRRLTGGAAAAIDFVGCESSARLGVSSLATGGKLVVVGLFGGALTLSLPHFPLRSIAIEGSYVGSPREMAELMERVRAGAIPPIPVETRPLASATATLEELKQGRIVGRVVLRP